jgi:hypothetical protein
MSVTSNIHTAIVYDAKVTKPQHGQRLIVTIAKADKAGNYGPHLQQTMATSVPILGADNLVDALNDDALQVRLMPHLVEWLHAQQNGLVAARIKTGQKTVTTEELEIPAILAYLDSETVGDKWDASRVAAWFDGVMAEPIGVALIEKGLPESELEGKLVAWGKIFSDCFGSRAAIPMAKAKMLEKALALGPSGDPILARFKARIDKMMGVGLEEELGL